MSLILLLSRLVTSFSSSMSFNFIAPIHQILQNLSSKIKCHCSIVPIYCLHEVIGCIFLDLWFWLLSFSSFTLSFIEIFSKFPSLPLVVSSFISASYWYFVYKRSWGFTACFTSLHGVLLELSWSNRGGRKCPTLTYTFSGGTQSIVWKCLVLTQCFLTPLTSWGFSRRRK